jgi:hypothetical protein
MAPLRLIVLVQVGDLVSHVLLVELLVAEWHWHRRLMLLKYGLFSNNDWLLCNAPNAI